MNLKSKWTLGLSSLAIAAMGSVMVASAQSSPSPQAPPPQNKPDNKPDNKKPEENHPRLQKAIEELRDVKKHLEKAPHDFGGHRADAVKAVTEAIKQLELAVKFDKN